MQEFGAPRLQLALAGSQHSVAAAWPGRKGTMFLNLKTAVVLGLALAADEDSQTREGLETEDSD